MGLRGFGVAAVAVGLVGLAWFLALRPEPTTSPEIGASLSVSQVLGGDPGEGYARALESRPFLFPEDHGPHPSFRTEWWYLTGNLSGPGGEPYGFQLTFFRSALRPGGDAADALMPPGHAADALLRPGDATDAVLPPGDAAGQLGSSGPYSGSIQTAGDSSNTDWSTDGSPWRTRQVYMGHLAVTDGRGGTFRAFERFSREALDLAGARAQPFRVWLEDWELRGPSDSPAEIFPMALTAEENGIGLSLSLVPSKPMVLQGERGLSRKGPEPGNASFYYSFTRLESRGWLMLAGDTVAVEGSVWMDREWSTSALSPGQVGWDWFALQLSDGSDLMYYQLRRQDGTADPYSKGVLVDPEGVGSPLGAEDLRLDVLEEWESPVDGARYPSRWALEVPSAELSLEIVPLIPDQELRLTFRYWEGAVRVTGMYAAVPVEGRGYAELTGYAGILGQAQPGMVSRNQVPR